MTQDELKKAVARAAFEYVEGLLEDDTIVGVGTGSTANYFIAELGNIKHKLNATVASSEESARRLKEFNIPVLDLNSAGTVAVYVDGVPQTQPGSVFSTMLDIERIEVLNGPQGTLYGKNAPAGLISIYTGTPHTEGFDGYITSSYSSWETWNNTMAVNIPLVKNKLALRIAGMYAESDGYMDNAIPGVDESNGKEHKGVPCEPKAGLCGSLAANAQSVYHS